MNPAVIFDWIGTLYERDKGPYPYSETVLLALKGRYKLGLISIASRGEDARRKEVETSGLLKFFDAVIIGGAKTKESFLQCMEMMGANPQSTAIVDDRTIRGIKIGNDLGCKTFWIQKGDYSRELPNEDTGQPTFKIDSIEDLLRYL